MEWHTAGFKKKSLLQYCVIIYVSSRNHQELKECVCSHEQQISTLLYAPRVPFVALRPVLGPRG